MPSQSRQDNYYHLAETYALMGNSTEATKLLEEPISWEWAFNNLYLIHWWLEGIAMFDPIREDESFKKLTQKKRLEYNAYAETLRQLVREKEINWEIALERNR